ncbi:MAG TPA: class I SAM-dependent methyltransferase [Urbifossiella sp.]
MAANQPIPDWQLPPGVDRGLWDYLNSTEMAAGYDEQMAASPLARADVAFCEKWFPEPGKLLDMGCGTGRLCLYFAKKGFECVGVDLSEEMLAKARTLQEAHSMPRVGSGSANFIQANLIDLKQWPDSSFEYAACLFSTLGMIRGEENRVQVLANAFRLLKPGGRFVLHVHNRYFPGLGWRNWGKGDITMPQAYGGAPLTLFHFTLRDILLRLAEMGFEVKEVRAVGIDGAEPRWPRRLRAYGYLLAGEHRA